MSWRQLTESVQSLAEHILLFTTTLFLVLKLDHTVSYSWGVIFAPLWLFHALMARTRFSLPAPTIPHDRHWAPCHAVVATPLLVSFELLLCVYLETTNAYGYEVVNLKVVFLPLLILAIIILTDTGVSPNCIISNSMAAKSVSSYINPHNLVSDRMSRYPPEVVKKMPKNDLAEEVWRLQAVLGEQAEASKHCQQEYERLQTEKVLCRVCFVRDMSVVLLPCRHHILCSNCAEKCMTYRFSSTIHFIFLEPQVVHSVYCSKVLKGVVATLGLCNQRFNHA